LHDARTGLERGFIGGLGLAEFDDDGGEVGIGFVGNEGFEAASAIRVERLGGFDAGLDAAVVGDGVDDEVFAAGEGFLRRADVGGGAGREAVAERDELVKEGRETGVGRAVGERVDGSVFRERDGRRAVVALISDSGDLGRWRRASR
jgi:hypothetical protein